MRIKKFLLITLKTLRQNMSKVTKTRQQKYKVYGESAASQKRKKNLEKKKKVLDSKKVVWYYIKAVREAAVYLVN